MSIASDHIWRTHHLGHWLTRASERFDARVQSLLSHQPTAPLTLSRLAERGQLRTAPLHLLRHLPENGARLSDIAKQCGMRKQSMTAVVKQGMGWGIVELVADPHDARSRRVVFTVLGLQWVEAYERAVAQAQAEFRESVGTDVATVVALGLEAYTG